MFQADHHDICLSGILSKMPPIPKSKFDETEIVIDRVDDLFGKKNQYRVILHWDDAMMLINHGYVGIMLTIHADLRVRDQVEIVAEKVSFTTNGGDDSSEEFLYGSIILNKTISEFQKLCFNPTIHTMH